jgi:Fe-S cluster assembly protein SufD
MDTLEKTTIDIPALQSMRDSFEGRIPDSFAPSRNASLSALDSMGFPSTKEEYWKYTRTARIAKKNWTFTEASEIRIPSDIPDAKYRVVFANGVYQPDLSTLPEVRGFEFSPFSSSETESPMERKSAHIFEAMNTAMPQDGYVITLARGAVVEEVIQVIHLYEGRDCVVQPRTHVVLSDGAELRLTELHLHQSESLVFANLHQEVLLGKDARFKCDIIQKGSKEGFHLNEIFGNLSRGSIYTQNTFTLGGNWTRNNSTLGLKGEFIECNLNGFYIPNGKEHVDNHTIIDHEMPNCESNELYRGVLLDKSVGVFNGKVFVRPDAQKTNAFQSNGNVVVSDDATMNSKPELEIYADDVKCSHGSTTGQLDEDALFYLQSRGLSRDSARKMLIGAFAEDVLEKLVESSLRSIIESTIHTKLD